MMPLPKMSKKPFFSLVSVVTLAGCAALPPTGLDNACQSQVPTGYSITAAMPLGTLTVHVVDEHGVLLPNASVQAIGPNQNYHIQCLAGANAATGGDGIAHLERMKVGNYHISAYRATGDQTVGAETLAKIEPNKATVVTLTVKTIH
jgi:hypothetical protein